MSIVKHPRAPLGLPPGSVRGILALSIMLIFWILMLVPDDQAIPIPLNLYMLMSMVMVFFVAHGKSIAKRTEPTASPLWLPGGSLRFLIVAGTLATLVYVGLNHPERFDRLNPTAEQLSRWKSYFLALGIGFVLGYSTHILPSRLKHSWGFQTFQAWTAIIAMAIVFLELIFQVFINRTLLEPMNGVIWPTTVTAIVAFYFGSRS